MNCNLHMHVQYVVMQNFSVVWLAACNAIELSTCFCTCGISIVQVTIIVLVTSGTGFSCYFCN